MKKSVIKNIFLSFGIVLLVAVLGTIFVNLGTNWFNLTQKPSQWLPNFVIPIVWTVIYLFFACVIYVSISKNNLPKNIIILLIINGILNILWCLLFFTLNLTFLGLIAIVINLIFGIYLLIKIYGWNKNYFYILSIYPIWLSIATCLNLAIWILN